MKGRDPDDAFFSRMRHATTRPKTLKDAIAEVRCARLLLRDLSASMGGKRRLTVRAEAAFDMVLAAAQNVEPKAKVARQRRRV